MKRLQALLTDHRKVRNLSVRELARQIGISHTSLHRFENGSNLGQAQYAKLFLWILTHDK